MERSNNIYIGRKPVMSYCLACMTAMQGDVKEINIMARGRAISKAVDVAEVLRNQYMKELTVKDISIGTETLETEEGGSRNVSNMTIVLAKE